MNDENANNDKRDWDEKKRKILDNIDGAISYREKALREISVSQKNLGEVSEIVIDDLFRLHQIKEVYVSNEAYLRSNPVYDSSLANMTSLSTYDLGAAQTIASSAKVLRTNTDSLSGTISTSSSLITSMSTITVNLADQMTNKAGIISFVEKINKPSPKDRKDELLPQLDKIESRLATKLEGAWQTLHDGSKSDRFLQSASSARELTSDLLHILSPDEPVKDSKWFTKETPNGVPAQRQRARFAMLGRNDAIGDNELKSVYELGDSIRDAYTSLNSIAHLRNYDADLEKLTASLIDQIQVYLLKLLELRNTYYKY